MSTRTTRRGFLWATGAGGAVCSGLSVLVSAWSSPQRAAAAEPQSAAARQRRRAMEAEIRRRARRQCEQTRLTVDYYRIGRKIAYPLPLPELIVPEVVVPTIPNYPWSTWLLWVLEERICCLGWAAEWFGDEAARQAAAADLAALAQWPKYEQYSRPGLCSAHAGRILWTASTRWKWVDEKLRHSLREACARHSEAALPGLQKTYGSISTKQDVLAQKAPHALVHNIPVIGTIGAALTAATAGHRAISLLNTYVQVLFGAILDLRAKGHAEGVAYDGYVLDFVADWLSTLPPSQRSAILDHPSLNRYLEQSYMLGAPGATDQVAELSDVEPRQMPFHLSAQAKLERLQPQPVRTWLLSRCPLDVLRTDALAAMCETVPTSAGKAPVPGALDAHYALVLRSGWESEDLAVAAACSQSPMGHIQSDSGTIVIGTRGKWLITDPGYQQYVQGAEREFTIGPTAHNAPLVNGQRPTYKRPRRVLLENVTPNLHRAAIDLTACYPAAASAKSLVRHIWLSRKDLVVVADQMEAEKPARATYHWHGHPDAAWWFEDGWALVSLGDVRLWLTCTGRPISAADLHRLPGSRGQLTLISTVDGAGPVVWWVFALSANRPRLQVTPDTRGIKVFSEGFHV